MDDKLKIKQIDDDTIMYNGKEFKAVKKDGYTDRWSPTLGDIYIFISVTGNVNKSNWNNDLIDKDRLKVSNVYPTEEAAKKSLLFYALNSEYDYWIYGMELPDNGDGWERYDGRNWEERALPPKNWNYLLRRKLKSKRRYV